MKNLLISGVVLILMVIDFSFISNIKKTPVTSNRQVSVSRLPTAIPTVVVQISPSVADKFPDSKKFSSASLRIEFNYLPKVDDSVFKIQESGSKVYIYTGSKPEDGQSVELFQKPQDLSLSEAIGSKFLAGKSQKDCWVVDTTENYKEYPASYRIAEITFPKPGNSDASWWELGSKCSPYAQSNGIRYFLYDSDYPGKYAFFDIGQYVILAADKTPWQDTFRFVN